MKQQTKILIVLFFLLFSLPDKSYSQAGKIVFQGSFGLVFPYDDLKASDYVNYDSLGYIFVDSSLFANHFGAQPGMMFAGSAKFNFDKYSIARAVLSVAFTGFNNFQAVRTGTTLVKFVNNTYQQRPIEYDYSFSNFGIGLGLELAPTSFTKLISPFFNANFNLNFFSANLSRRSGFNDSISVNLNSFRMGVNFNAGIEVMINNSIGVVAGVKYDLGNLILKDTKRDGYIEWGSQDASLNDEYGRYISNIYYPIGEGYNYFESKQKKINWGTAYIGINFNPFYEPPATKKPKEGKKMLYGYL